MGLDIPDRDDVNPGVLRPLSASYHAYERSRKSYIGMRPYAGSANARLTFMSTPHETFPF